MYYLGTLPHNPCEMLKEPQVIFDEKWHKYCVKIGGVTIGCPSVTEIINKVFGDKYSKVPADVLARAQKRGSEIHREIKEYLTEGKYGVSLEFGWFKNAIEKDIIKGDKCWCENYIYAEHEGNRFCGTMDTFWITGLLVDYKTSYRLDKQSVKVQLNMYAYALRNMGYKADRLEAWHFTKSGLKRVPIKLEGPEYVENILRAYFEGREFDTDKELMDFYESDKNPESPKTLKSNFVETCKRIKDIDEALEKLNKVREKCINEVKSEMERIEEPELNIVGLGMKLNYIPSSIRETLNKERVKELLLPEAYLECLKKTNVAAHIRIIYKEK